MTFEEYATIKEWQESNITSEMIQAIQRQGELHRLCQEKMDVFYKAEEEYRELFKKGVDKLFLQYPEIRETLPKGETYIERFLEILAGIHESKSKIKRITPLMKNIEELVEAEKMNVELGKACVEFFDSFALLTYTIAEDRKKFFTAEYLNKMDELAEEGVFMYFLETPDFPLLKEGVDANFILDSFIFADYISTKTILSSFFIMSMPAPSMTRKQEDIAAAVTNMEYGFPRTAARNWLALMESEHKKCAEVMEGYFEKARQFKKGEQRSKKITELLDKIDNFEWEQRAWKKIDTYYRKMTGKEVKGIPNRNIIVHGDYNSDAIDITDRDVIKIMLMWLNLRLIADTCSFIQEFYENKITMLPYLCKALGED